MREHGREGWQAGGRAAQTEHGKFYLRVIDGDGDLSLLWLLRLIVTVKVLSFIWELNDQRQGRNPPANVTQHTCCSCRGLSFLFLALTWFTCPVPEDLVLLLNSMETKHICGSYTCMQAKHSQAQKKTKQTHIHREEGREREGERSLRKTPTVALWLPLPLDTHICTMPTHTNIYKQCNTTHTYTHMHNWKVNICLKR